MHKSKLCVLLAPYSYVWFFLTLLRGKGHHGLDCNLNWDLQHDHAIKEANQNLFAIKVISKYFTQEEKKTLLTSLFYSKLFISPQNLDLENSALKG